MRLRGPGHAPRPTRRARTAARAASSQTTAAVIMSSLVDPSEQWQRRKEIRGLATDQIQAHQHGRTVPRCSVPNDRAFVRGLAPRLAAHKGTGLRREDPAASEAHAPIVQGALSRVAMDATSSGLSGLARTCSTEWPPSSVTVQVTNEQHSCSALTSDTNSACPPGLCWK